MTIAEFRKVNPSLKADIVLEGKYAIKIPQDKFVIYASTEASSDSCQVD